MTSTEERVQILEMIEAGTISPEEGLKLLQALEAPQEEETDLDAPGLEYVSEFADPPQSEEDLIPNHDPEDMRKWKRWWMIPLWIGVGITVISGFLMYAAWNDNGLGFWFACTWFPFLLGVGVLALAWGSRTSPWLHLRIHQKPGEKPERIAFSFPLPIRLSAWFLRVFGRFIPNMDATGLDEVILSLKETTNEDTPLIVNVDEGEDGERVQIIIG